MKIYNQRDGTRKVILDLCGGSGAWSRPYLENGYDVRVITLPDYDVCSYTPPENVYGILAAPPCTEFSVAKTTQARDFREGMRTVEACERIIRHCRLYGNLKFWALENPRGYLRQFIGIPKFTFEQWQYGGDQRKPTDIYGAISIRQRRPSRSSRWSITRNAFHAAARTGAHGASGNARRNTRRML